MIVKNDIMSVLGLDEGYTVKYTLCLQEFPRALPAGTPSGKGVYLTVYLSSRLYTDTVSSLRKQCALKDKDYGLYSILYYTPTLPFMIPCVRCRGALPVTSCLASTSLSRAGSATTTVSTSREQAQGHSCNFPTHSHPTSHLSHP